MHFLFYRPPKIWVLDERFGTFGPEQEQQGFFFGDFDFESEVFDLLWELYLIRRV